MTTQEVLMQLAKTIDELREELENEHNKYNVSYQEGYSDAIAEFEELVLNLENEYLYKSNADNGNAN